ncbi:hormogonium polysaccharide biosynthesis glycosyltransferase HpsP [Umezakia ovalisporum]|jgi:glycosyltransferase involved in cell wall biosynthesis|uniref:Hormogonium polysaccharide biosynthesis glycosyltransferase HpsP n=2 Tax=Umezakia ovalisporum TaxID=75695 RepID=A0AA43KE28_9CYAN|nr:hormogonium polysaccharide biosynthesis glycosyltransferase HpsP [Umezakia ovalisporum]MBI1241338.1 glycosyltransferase [Nostoc sp. RI_552]MDH6055288.1 hormogonium polysaccharide biosynthesis glycosyltransferase HpsP [Umezakia ovalisporum FSS-43]MDH6062593.1 hormogonium polysaccharide biosynthesis glycosyltransferase HpsP [Umezakia ovalisporum FSS-62]MDH6066381.1 hormogonium polysaccharide biosynthesis glycosyltransferase HpsP [Umezakia ovalisporum APH033B]MDH6071223.1 hormogonium polysacch
MKILQIIPSISLIYGGPSQMVINLASTLAKEQLEITILTTDSNGDTGQQPLHVPLNHPVQQDGYQIIYFRCSPFRRYKFSLNLLKWLKIHACEFDLAHIHALFSPVSTAAARVCRQQKLPYILRPLGTLDPADLRKKKQLKQLYVQLMERRNIAGAAAIHFTSNQEAKISERFGVATRDLVIPLGVIPPKPIPDAGNIVRNQFKIPPDFPLVLFMSRIDQKKGLNLLLPALEKLLASQFNFHFVLAGTNSQDPDYEQKIKSHIANSPLRSHTTITGFVSGELKASLLQAADLFVLPSYYENFGIAVAEAMVAGIPVVISDHVHIWQQVHDSKSGWIGKTEVETFVELIKEALQNPQQRQQRGLNAQQYALQHFSWSAIARQTIQAYQQIITK